VAQAIAVRNDAKQAGAGGCAPVREACSTQWLGAAAVIPGARWAAAGPAGTASATAVATTAPTAPTAPTERRMIGLLSTEPAQTGHWRIP
jgi:hypothetical protein